MVMAEVATCKSLCEDFAAEFVSSQSAGPLRRPITYSTPMQSMYANQSGSLQGYVTEQLN